MINNSETKHMQKLSAVYYPFSRCIDPGSMKQMLLVFDELTFMDPVEDEEWRKKLLKDFEKYAAQFAGYGSIGPELPLLLEHGCVRRIAPTVIGEERQKIASASALCDLQDSTWTRFASNPLKYQMPSNPYKGRSSWQVFRAKLPPTFIDGLKASDQLAEHLLFEADELTAWSLSYEAGSAITTALHLEAADAIGAAPITDSPLHHRLLMLKAAREKTTADKESPIPEEVIERLSADIAVTMLSNVLPQQTLAKVTFKEILAFRDETSDIRHAFAQEIQAKLGVMRTVATADDWRVARQEVLNDLEMGLRTYDADFQSSRAKIWPGLVESVKTAVRGGGIGAGVGAVALSPLGPVASVVVGSIIGGSLDFLGSSLTRLIDQRRSKNSASPSVAYLSTVKSELA